MRSRVGIAAQAIGVAALGTIVYLAFLHPRDSGSLSGIEIEEGVELEAPQFQTTRGHRDSSEGDRDRVGPVATKRSVPSTRPGPPPVSGPTVDTPTGSQYGDAVARILGQVSQARP